MDGVSSMATKKLWIQRWMESVNDKVDAAATPRLEPQDLPTFLSYLSAITTAAGILPEQILTVYQTLTDLGVNAHTAGRFVRGLVFSQSSQDALGILEDALGELLPTERAAIGTALIKDIETQGQTYDENLQMILTKSILDDQGWISQLLQWPSLIYASTEEDR
ncbi:MAG: hypothetical protein M1497_15995 [Nitrospirae bacterium]|nr:hypothetical protein [Nitrospirota bacterium]